MSPEAYKTFSSSPGVIRGFCKDCGSTLTWHDTTKPDIDVTIGTIDDIRAADLKITEAVVTHETY